MVNRGHIRPSEWTMENQVAADLPYEEQQQSAETSDDYYSTMLDLDGLDPELKGLGALWEEGEDIQRALLSCLFSEQRIDLAKCLVNAGIFAPNLGEKVHRALDASKRIFGQLVPEERMSPKGLAKKELLLWRPELRDQLDELLAVEVPVRNDWKLRGIDLNSQDSVLEFYCRTESYIFELMAANNLVQTLYNYDVIIEKLHKLGVTAFLDYGAGIGSFLILAESHGMQGCYMDLDSETSSFAKWRFGVRTMDFPLLSACGDHSDIPPSDAIVCTEVIEHVFDPLQLLDRIAEAVPRGGIVVISESCLHIDKFVAHLPQNRWLGGANFDREMRKRGFGEVLPEPSVHPRVFRKHF